MRIKKFLMFLIIYVLIGSSVFIFFNPAFMKDIPRMDIYKDKLLFSGDEAYKKLEYLVKTFPSRDSGSKNNVLAAEWMSKQFRDLGMKTYIEQFQYTDYLRKANIFFNNILFSSLNELLTTATGTNVYAVSEGESREIILIGAHRDTIHTIDGAEDNGSGSASMLELARVLTQNSHYYTYVFVSFDTEEEGLIGSRAFVEKHRDMPVKLSVCLDVVGSRGADEIALFQYTNSLASTPLWTVGLSQNIIHSLDKELYYFIVSKGTNEVQNTSADLFKNYLLLKTADYVGTDSGSFMRKDIPSVGFMATKAGEILRSKSNFRQIHGPEDSFDKISPDTLNMVGRFTEQYIRSVELNKISNLESVGSKKYMLLGNKYIPAYMLNGFIAFISVMCLLILLLTYRNTRKINLSGFILGEIRTLIVSLVLSAASILWWLLLKIDFFRDIPITIYLIFWLVIVLVFMAITPRIRKRYLGGDIMDSKVLSEQKVFLNAMYFLLFILFGIALNFYIALIVMLPAILVLGRIGTNPSGRNLLRMLFSVPVLALYVIWSIYCCIKAFNYDITSARHMLMAFLCVFNWIISAAYSPVSARLYGKHKSRIRTTIRTTY